MTVRKSIKMVKEENVPIQNVANQVNIADKNISFYIGEKLISISKGDIIDPKYMLFLKGN